MELNGWTFPQMLHLYGAAGAATGPFGRAGGEPVAET
jgi:hypothetical protein